MYSPPIHGSNNPFAEDPRAESVRARYPDLTGQESGLTNSQYTSWLNRPAAASPLNTNVSGPYGGSQGPMSPQGYGYQPTPQPIGQQWSQGSGFSQPQQSYPQTFSQSPVAPQMSGMPFSPSSSFGQQLVTHMNGPYNGLQEQPQQYTGYVPQYGQSHQLGQQAHPPSQQQPSHYLPEFDPYAVGSTPRGGPGLSGAPAQGPPSSQQKSPHPREYVQSHRTELEQWDTYTWKQVQNCLEELRLSWETRKNVLEGQLKAMGGAGFFGAGGYGAGPAQQYAFYENLVKEATHNIDSITALSFQLQEVIEGYRQSSDISSKRRVRESMNSAISQLPDFPQPLF